MIAASELLVGEEYLGVNYSEDRDNRAFGQASGASIDKTAQRGLPSPIRVFASMDSPFEGSFRKTEWDIELRSRRRKFYTLPRKNQASSPHRCHRLRLCSPTPLHVALYEPATIVALLLGSWPDCRTLGIYSTALQSCFHAFPTDITASESWMPSARICRPEPLGNVRSVTWRCQRGLRFSHGDRLQGLSKKPVHSTSYMPIDNMSFHILSF